ncbi:SUMF1/EgtB/PvdO family nonheme iron enzyme [Marinihelvus fidelis]|uniref:SUMF1/EgtB/PvdO family nonheme iron enzyme n=1 Tax=Marinihelvus fidelis TaxID=2613842 RepID=A0A5N0TBZ0_9GAMM|nr:bifunctional serine/threonine-protein kinase/formylglycine-generating enzyme family protein [Marinihelvus fidelis]KAA9132593.1 SUMF1/EgtB/PvdO family nonheme iron enzyme [Marinihelvus fidelis]
MNRPATLPAGSQVDGLVINRLLRQTAESAVYEVTDPAIDARFALKEYLPEGLALRDDDGHVSPRPGDEGAFEAGLARFRREARLAAGIEHPALARVIRLFDANGTSCQLMPLYGGEPLLEALGSAPAAGLARTVTLSLMDAVAALHELDLVHRDIKPGNVLVDDDGRVTLMDHGGLVETDADARRGTPGYAAPEQYDAARSVGAQADIYGLAAALYHALTGEPPVPADVRQAAKDAGQADPLLPARERLPASRYGGLGDAIDHGLRLDPANRPESVAQWRRAYESLDWRLDAGRAETAEDTTEKREWLSTALFATLGLVLVAIAVFLLGGDPERLPEPSVDSGRQAPEAGPTGSGNERAASPEERAQWQAALDADTLLGYRRFLEAWPDSIFREQARLQINVLDERAWQELSEENTRGAYSRYLEQFPGGLHEADALRAIERIDEAEARAERERLARQAADQAAWDQARTAGTVAAMDEYIRTWPAGDQVETARALRRQLLDQANESTAWDAALKLDTTESYQAYIDAFPDGEHVADALAAIDGFDLRPGRSFRDCDTCPEMIVIPAGAFQQGSDAADAPTREQPAHAVRIARDFAAGMYEVTMAQWDACVDAGGCEAAPSDNGWGREERPVIMVSWNDAQQYAHWLSQLTGETYRLPTESEWEYMARARESGDFPFGDPAQVCSFGNIAGMETEFRWRHQACADSTALGTLPVGQLRPNDYGLFDVIGNVAEWTADCMNLSYIDAPADGRAWTRGICSSRMARGGSWVTGTRDIRYSARFDLKAGDRNDFTGFRVVRELRD